jgi:hypothetical protein
MAENMILINSPQRRGVRREKDVFFSFAGERPANENPQPLHGRISLNNTSHATKPLSDAP